MADYLGPPIGRKDGERREDQDPFLARLKVTDRQMDDAYKKFLEKEKRPEAEVISLEDIEDGDGSSDHRIRRMTELCGKYGEYTLRLKNDRRSEQESPVQSRGDYFKREAVRILLARGEVNTWALSNAMAEVNPHFRTNGAKFENGCAVVHSYVRNGGRDVTGGTGLPNFTGRAPVGVK